MHSTAKALVDAADRAVPRWVHRSVRQVCARQHIALDGPHLDRLREVAEATRVEVTNGLVALLETDVDDQRGNPLDVIRRSVHLMTDLLVELGARPVARDEFAVRLFPHDLFALGPAAFVDVDDEMQEPGIVWGAWKAKTVLDRRRAEGRLPPRDG